MQKEAVAAAKLAICQKEAAEMRGAIEAAKSNVHAYAAEHAKSQRHTDALEARCGDLSSQLFALRSSQMLAASQKSLAPKGCLIDPAAQGSPKDSDSVMGRETSPEETSPEGIHSRENLVLLAVGEDSEVEDAALLQATTSSACARCVVRRRTICDTSIVEYNCSS